MMLKSAEIDMVYLINVGSAPANSWLTALITGTIPAFMRILSREMERMAGLISLVENDDFIGQISQSDF